MRGPMLTRLWFPFGQVLFGLWLFNVLPTKPPAWLTDGPLDDPIIANPETARAAFLTMLTLISLGPFVWIDTARLRGRTPFADLPAMVKLVLLSRRGVMTFIVLALFLGQTAWFVVMQGVPIGSLFVRINLAIACGVLMTVLVPPAAIVLACSAPWTGSGKLLEVTAKSFFPFRVVSLLDGARLGPAIFANKNDNLRTIGKQSWRQAVHRLVDITRLVIVDARSSTPPVCEEIAYMLHPARIHKAIFVVNDDGSAPGLDAVGDARDHELAGELGLSVAQLVRLRHPQHVHCCGAADIPLEVARFRTSGTVARG